MNNVVTLKPRPRKPTTVEALAQIDSELGAVLVRLANRHGHYAVTTVMTKYLAEAVERARLKHLPTEDAWLADLAHRFDVAMMRAESHTNNVKGKRRIMRALTTIVLSIALAVTGCATQHGVGADRDSPPVELAPAVEKPAADRTWCDRWCFWLWGGGMLAASLVALHEMDTLPNVPRNKGCQYNPGAFGCPTVANAKRNARGISLQLTVGITPR